jgi:xylan 1,4-beta-xylosidase
MEAQGLVQGYSFWTFSDIFSENYFPSVPFHGGFGLLNLREIAKPAYRAFQLLHRLGFESLEVAETHATVDA